LGGCLCFEEVKNLLEQLVPSSRYVSIGGTFCVLKAICDFEEGLPRVITVDENFSSIDRTFYETHAEKHFAFPLI